MRKVGNNKNSTNLISTINSHFFDNDGYDIIVMVKSLFSVIFFYLLSNFLLPYRQEKNNLQLMS